MLPGSSRVQRKSNSAAVVTVNVQTSPQARTQRVHLLAIDRQTDRLLVARRIPRTERGNRSGRFIKAVHVQVHKLESDKGTNRNVTVWVIIIPAIDIGSILVARSGGEFGFAEVGSTKDDLPHTVIFVVIVTKDRVAIETAMVIAGI